MKILIWECQCCSKNKCIMPFSGQKNSSRFERPDFCLNDVTCETDPWKLRKVDSEFVVDRFMSINKEWKK